MNKSGIFSFKYLKRGLIGVLLACVVYVGSFRYGHIDAWAGWARPAQTQVIPPLSADDVSWLFPAPTRTEDVAKLIAVNDLTTPNPQDTTKRDSVWPDAVFQRFVAIASSQAAQVGGQQIGLPAAAQSKAAWFIAGVRFDPGAPGLTDDIRGQFGQFAEIRLIVQPVIRNPDGTPKVLDIAGHLIFDFPLKADPPAQSGCSPRPLPDVATFNTVIADVAALRTKLATGQLGPDKVATAGKPLGIHPGLADPSTENNVRQEMIALLEKYISGQRLDAMAIAGLPAGAPEPWIFLSMVLLRPGQNPALPNGGFVPVPGPTLDGQQFAQMLQPARSVPRVVPQPHTNNLNPITCKSAAVPTANLPIADRMGVSTADLFVNPPPPSDKVKQTLDLIADPAKSHFFNTDCVSCHTETERSRELLSVNSIPGIDPAVLPSGPWDVRNFGWAPNPTGSTQPTVTRRTAAETAAVVSFINSQLLADVKVLNH